MKWCEVFWVYYSRRGLLFWFYCSVQDIKIASFCILWSLNIEELPQRGRVGVCVVPCTQKSIVKSWTVWQGWLEGTSALRRTELFASSSVKYGMGGWLKSFTVPNFCLFILHLSLILTGFSKLDWWKQWTVDWLYMARWLWKRNNRHTSLEWSVCGWQT